MAQNKDNLFSGSNVLVVLLLTLVSYPLFYFSYKFCLPDFGGQDYYAYQYLYNNWSFTEVPSPFNMRLISSYFIFLMNKIGFCYDTETVFAGFHPDLSLQVFFNATLFNYLCVVATSFIIYRIIMHSSGNKVYSFMAGCTYLLGFGTLFFSLKPLSEACGIMLVSIALLLYIKENYWLFLVLFISLFQREYVFIVFGIMSLADFYFKKNKYFLIVFICSILFFCSYYILRKTFFYTPHFEFQTAPTTFFHSLLKPDIDIIPFIKQTLFASNLLIIYFFVLMYKKYLGLSISKNHLINISLLFGQVILMSIMARFGNNAGRYFYYGSPILIYYIFDEMMPLLSQSVYFKKNV